ncbi:hypothetical protein VOLCADRAFT_92792 [Volvox carteri f. nagariensis]|uniref:dolichyl-phosphate beta-glucosyltransferase n=1 Tax=Volvox carteri f. nagariensis TaxID=3068 RepID=D8U0H5_VOLCA|nr:uncharacterized protein VOLCADRAFT_92792 [Volvox carteri f. nagariensis]EFJ46724.1 hypothetical protein VOLCADRAFT_92792 [Volvox carteri f. nagariensis]|eukprot:XP_002952253.1 hypothetical protein VOLCADRAFT_92792 [Volvox carteri f. nagariensis]
MFYDILLWLGLLAAGYTLGKVINLVTALSKEFTEPISCTLEDPDSTSPVACPSIFDAPTKALSCIIPAYNEEDRLPSTLDEALAYLQRRRDRQGPQFTYELIIVDDGSKDGTARVAQSYVRKYGMDTVRLLRVSANRGKGHAVKRGMLAARGEYCLLMDADGATRFSDLEKLEAELDKILQPSFGRSSAASAATGDTQGPLGVAYGSRAHLHKDAIVKRSRLRNFLTRGFHMLVYFVAGGRIRDTQCGFKLFTRRSAAILFSNMRLQRWCFDVELLYLAEQLQIPVCEVFVNWTEIPGSKIRFTSILLMALELLIIKARPPATSGLLSATRGLTHALGT